MAEFDFEKQPARPVKISGVSEFFRFRGEIVAKCGLLFHQRFDERLEFVELVGRLRGGPGNDQRSPGFIDEDGVHFVDDREVMSALDLLVFGGGHAVVAKIVEAELGVGSVGDIAGVLLAPVPWCHLVLDTTDGQSEETEQRAHPVGVAFGEVIIDRDDMHTEAGERVEENRKRGD